MLRLMLGLMPPVLLVAFFMAPAYIATITAALLMGAAGAIMGSIRRAMLAAALAPVPMFGSLIGIDPRIAALALTVIAGFEACRFGGRSFSLSLIAAVMLVHGQNLGTDIQTALVVFAAGVCWSLGIVKWLKFDAKAAAPAIGLRESIGLALLLALGLLVSVAIVEHSEQPFAYWIILMFLFRALAPTQQLHIRTWKFAQGAIAGAGIAMLLEIYVMPGAYVRLAIAFAAAFLGLRYVTLVSPLPAMFFCVGILLLGAPTPEAAGFRIEAVLIVAFLVLCLSEFLRMLLVKRE
ncbi:hypothetical protein [Roseovarius albus]|uniref:hypothetical protein n=1 Tax=Roseovarius albus TaxID=1247867 RepID=UPI001179947E|nr:hypothetical protein [Roseovarius albus]